MAKEKEPATETAPAPAEPETQIFFGGSGPPLHELFQQQARAVLDNSDLDEQAKDAILALMNCPCCGTGGMNYVAKINRRK